MFKTMPRAAFCFVLSFVLAPLLQAREAPTAAPVVTDIRLTAPSQEAPQNAFTAADRTITATVILNVTAPAQIHIAWYRSGNLYAKIPVHLTKAAQAWHARSYVHAIPGQWDVRVMQGDNHVLGHKTFDVTAHPQTVLPQTKPKKIKSVKEILRALEPTNK